MKDYPKMGFLKRLIRNRAKCPVCGDHLTYQGACPGGHGVALGPEDVSATFIGMAEEQRAFMPHCDSTVLHAPGECEFCDQYPDWQSLRELWRINYTGKDDHEKVPCPSLYFRDIDLINRWPGNLPKRKDQ